MTRRQYYAFWITMFVCVLGGAAFLFTPWTPVAAFLATVGLIVCAYAYRKGWVRDL